MLKDLIGVREHDLRTYWSQLIFNVASEDKTQYDSLRATEINEFFYLLRAYEKNTSIRQKSTKPK